MKKILITGATGFVGSHLTELCIERGFEVVAFDRYGPNRSLGWLEKSKYKNDMDTISSVYHNRLNKDMLLQADPTIQYILPVKKKRVMYKDTKIVNPYNTYINKGLPPGPINNPGINAIVAAGMPPNTKYLYFVANGEGTHIFNNTYNDHLKSKRNVSRKSK